MHFARLEDFLGQSEKELQDDLKCDIDRNRASVLYEESRTVADVLSFITEGHVVELEDLGVDFFSRKQIKCHEFEYACKEYDRDGWENKFHEHEVRDQAKTSHLAEQLIQLIAAKELENHD